MFGFFDKSGGSRREFLRAGSLPLGGLTLAQLLAARQFAAADQQSARSFVRDKAVVLLFCHGGPSQIETFDPKITAPDGIRSVTGEVSTSLPGVTFGGTLPKLAALAHRTAVVRSFASGDGNHDIKPVVGRDTLNANLGSIYARIAGMNHPVNGIPSNVAVFPQSVDPTTGPRQEGFGQFHATGGLGTAFAPFTPGSGGEMQSDLSLNLPQERITDRRTLLAGLDRIRRSIDIRGQISGADEFQQQAFQTILGGIADVFDLSKEDPRVVARYDTAALMRPDMIDRKWNNYRHYVDHNKSLGRLMLLARRMCEAGCGFVTVTTNFVWDNHSDVNNAGIAEGMNYCSLALDHAVSTFLEDVHERGLSEKILLIVTGEMGRTPRINKTGGRDHWGNLTPLLLSGGGLQSGCVIGQSTRDAGEPASEKITIRNLVATVMHTLFDTGQLRLATHVPVDIQRLIATADPIPQLH